MLLPISPHLWHTLQRLSQAWVEQPFHSQISVTPSEMKKKTDDSTRGTRERQMVEACFSTGFPCVFAGLACRILRSQFGRM